MQKILVVDDIEANRKLLRQMLGVLRDFEIIEAADGEAAIVSYEENDPDLILMDINMPRMDGFQSASAIKKIVSDVYTPIIFVTALSESSLSDALSSGGDDFISKPFNADVLESKINAHLRIRELSLQLRKKNMHLIHEQELIEYFFESALKKSFIDEKVIKFHMSSMSTFNGDVLLIERGPQGGMYLVMGDFTGHGLTAAMGSLPVAMVFFKMVSLGVAIGDIARELNRQLYKVMPTGLFFAATLLEINARGDIMSVWKGGMPESYWLSKEGELKDMIHAQHMPLGILEDAEFDDAVSVYNVKKDDKIYLYSDGVTEAKGSSGEVFGDDRLKNILVSYKDNRFEQILAELKEFTGESGQADDITLLELSCHEIPAIEHNDEDCDDKDFALSWKTHVSFSAKEMREQDPVSELSDMLGSLSVLKRHKGVLHVLLSEIYLNALDHSVLGLDSSKKADEDQFEEYYSERAKRLQALEEASIVFDFTFSSDSNHKRLHIRMEDDGRGYDEESSTSHSDDDTYGRGMEIITSFCEEVSFSAKGRVLDITYRL